MPSNVGGFGFGGHPRRDHGVIGPASSPLLVGLERYYALNGDAVDSVGGVNGTLSGAAPDWTGPSIYAGDSMDLSLDSTSKFMANGYGSGDLTCSFWVRRRDSLGAFSCLIGNMTNPGSVTSGWCVLGSGSTITMYKDNNAPLTNGGGFQIQTTLTLNTYHMITIKRSGTTMGLYKDAVLVDSGTMAIVDPSANKFLIGCRPDAFALSPAYFQLVGLWGRALSDDQLTQLYNGGSGLVYPFI